MAGTLDVGSGSRLVGAAVALAGSRLADFDVGHRIGGKDVLPGAMAQTVTMHGVCSYVYQVTSRRAGVAQDLAPLALKVMINVHAQNSLP